MRFKPHYRHLIDGPWPEADVWQLQDDGRHIAFWPMYVFGRKPNYFASNPWRVMP